MAVLTASLSVGHSLSEHSMTFEFSDFKFMRLAGRLAQSNSKIRKSKEGFGLSVKVTRSASSAPLIGLQLSLSGPWANSVNKMLPDAIVGLT